MAKHDAFSFDKIEADYRKALAEYEHLRGPLRQRVLDLRRERDARLEEMDDDERDAWERSQAPGDAPQAERDDGR